MSLFFIKIIVTSLSVLVLGYIAYRGNPRLAGILTGFPIGTAIVAVFIAVENGPAIAADASQYSLAALSINPIFALAYYVIGVRFADDYRYKGTLTLALFVYFALATIVTSVMWTIISASLFLLVTTITVNTMLRRVSSEGKQRSVAITPGILFVRMLLASGVVIGVTEMVELVGPIWAGVFTPFPVTLVPLLVILHSTHGKFAAFAMIKGFGYSFLSTGVYLATITLLLPVYGTVISNLTAFLLAGVYVLALEFTPFIRRRQTSC